MATVSMVWQSLIAQITTAYQGTNPLVNSPAITPLPEIGIDWTAQKCIAAVSQGKERALISVFDRGATKNITKAIPIFNALPPIGPNPGAAITLSGIVLHPGQSITLTGAGVPLKNDAFCLTLMYGLNDPNQLFALYTVSTMTETLAASLTAFTAQINTLSDIVATLSGDVITVTNNSNLTFNVRSEVTGIATVTQEGYRWLRDIQITLWTPTPALRSTYGDVLELLFTQLEVNYGFFTIDNTACRLLVAHDICWTDSQLQDYYRRDFILQIDYAVLNTLPAYPIETIPQSFGIL